MKPGESGGSSSATLMATSSTLRRIAIDRLEGPVRPDTGYLRAVLYGMDRDPAAAARWISEVPGIARTSGSQFRAAARSGISNLRKLATGPVAQRGAARNACG